MDLAAITPESVFAMGSALTASAIGTGVEKKILAQAQQEGNNLAELIASSGGPGSQINTYA
jgi:hypothetical protein